MSDQFRDAFLRRAIELSRERMEAGHGGPFGALVTRGSEVIAEGWNQVLANNDPTAHAEIMAIRAACERLGGFHLDGCVLYTSCEPCPMCLGATIWARVGHVYYAAGRADAAAGFADEWMYEEMAAPLSVRRLPLVQRLRTEALTAFEAWRAKADRVEY
jgi:tRNA(Arg) A34 adenosine deaminase TadA